MASTVPTCLPLHDFAPWGAYYFLIVKVLLIYPTVPPKLGFQFCTYLDIRMHRQPITMSLLVTFILLKTRTWLHGEEYVIVIIGNALIERLCSFIVFLYLIICTTLIT